MLRFSFAKRFFFAALCSVLLLLLTRCGITNPDGSVTVDINPTAVTLSPGSTALFQGTETTSRASAGTGTIVLNKETDAFVWTISEGDGVGGTLAKDNTSSTGYIYTAPAAPGVYHVVISSKQDPWASATALITVQ